MEHPPPPGPAPFPPTRHSVLAALSSPDALERTRASERDERCRLAFAMLAYKAMQRGCSMIASMAGSDSITLNAGIAENDWSSL